MNIGNNDGTDDSDDDSDDDDLTTKQELAVLSHPCQSQSGVLHVLAIPDHYHYCIFHNGHHNDEPSSPLRWELFIIWHFLFSTFAVLPPHYFNRCPFWSLWKLHWGGKRKHWSTTAPLSWLFTYFRSTTDSPQYHVCTCFRYFSGYLLWCGFEILCTFIYLAFEISGFWITMITQTKKISNPSQVQVSCKIIILITTIFCAASTPSLTMNIYLHTSDTQ